MSSTDNNVRAAAQWASNKVLSISYPKENALRVAIGSAVEVFDTKFGEFFLQPSVLEEGLVDLLAEFGKAKVQCAVDIHDTYQIVINLSPCADHDKWVLLVENHVMHLLLLNGDDMLQQERQLTPAPTLCSLIFPIAHTA